MKFDRYAGMASAVGILLILTMIFWLGLDGPVTLNGVQGWQTLIGAVITALGLVVASWNVNRQMRLSAQGREQDRIEREIPGLRAALNSLSRFATLKAPVTPEAVLDLFTDVGLNLESDPDFVMSFDKLLPTTPDGIKRDVGQALIRLRVYARNLRLLNGAVGRLESRMKLAEAGGGDVADAFALLETQKRRRIEESALFIAHMEYMVSLCSKIRSRMVEERRRLELIRRQHDEFLGFNE